MFLSKQQQNELGISFVLNDLCPDSPMGQQLKRELKPFACAAELKNELANTQLVIDILKPKPTALDDIRHGLMRLKEVRLSIDSLANATASNVDMFEIKRFLMELEGLVPKMLAVLPQFSDISFNSLTDALNIIDPTKQRIATFYIESSLSAELAHARKMKQQDEQNRSYWAAQEDAQEQAIRQQLCKALAPFVEAMAQQRYNLALLDMRMAKARLALEGALIAQIGGTDIHFLNMQNPRVRHAVEQRGNSFCPISIDLRLGSTVITGANMGGKSVVLNTVAMNCYLAHLGLPVFAQGASLPFLNHIIPIGRLSDGVDRGLSDFGTEVTNIKQALELAKEGTALLLFDEPARGTNPTEGAAIARSLVSYCNGRGCYALFATHFDGTSKDAIAHYRIRGLKGDIDPSCGVENLSKYMDYTLTPAPRGQDAPREAFSICRALGLPNELLNEILNRLSPSQDKNCKINSSHL